MIDLPLRWAEAISFWANWVLIVALMVGVLATYWIVVSANIKEANWERQRIGADERIAATEAETARANESAVLAQERASKADAQAAEANLKAEKGSSPDAKIRVLIGAKPLS